MRIEKLEDYENAMLERRELTLRIVYDDSTPSFSEIRKQIAVAMGVDSNVLVVQSIRSKFGLREAIATANIYRDKSRAFQVESRHKLQKNFPEEFKPEGEVEIATREAVKEEPRETEEKETGKIEKGKEPSSESEGEIQEEE
jgi:small subunit ribosomal protein S24e